MARKKITCSLAIVFSMLTLIASLGTYPVFAQVHDVAVTNVTKFKSIIGQGFTMEVNVTAANVGGFPESFNVTLTGTRPASTTVSFNLFGSLTQGWGFTSTTLTSPGPTITVHQGDLVNVTLTSQDGAPHQFYVDYNGDHAPDNGEPVSPVFTGTINFQFIVSTLGTFTYYCAIHPMVMFGTFNVLAASPVTTQIGKQLVSLNIGSSAVLVFNWNTGLAKGNYTLTATAETVPGETNTANNVLVDGFVIVAMVGDVSGPTGWPDGKVDIRDLAAIATIYGVISPDPRYSANYDIVFDRKIDIKDLATAALNYGKIDP